MLLEMRPEHLEAMIEYAQERAGNDAAALRALDLQRRMAAHG